MQLQVERRTTKVRRSKTSDQRSTTVPELVMGHFFKTQPNPTPNFWTQPNPTEPIIDTWYGILGYTENFIQQMLHVTDKFTANDSFIQLQYSLADSRVFHDVKISRSQVSIQPNPPKIKKKTLTQPNPTQSMGGPNPWPTLHCATQPTNQPTYLHSYLLSPSTVRKGLNYRSTSDLPASRWRRIWRTT